MCDTQPEKKPVAQVGDSLSTSSNIFSRCWTLGNTTIEIDQRDAQMKSGLELKFQSKQVMYSPKNQTCSLKK